MRIVCDDKIPYIREALTSLADVVVYIPGSRIAPADVREADVLVVRTRTRCDRQLLEGSNVQLVVTATIGYDHLDVAWLAAAGIAWTNCPGCNASSVAQWVRESLLALERATSMLALSRMTLGIVGYGHVGRAVCRAMQGRVGRIVINDPLLTDADSHAAPPNISLAELCARADIISFHTPLTYDGAYATYHLADDAFFTSLARPTVIINAARGGVVDEQALLRAMDRGSVVASLIDTWQGEPNVNRELLQRAFVATPHIAGYSADGKANASRMAVEAIAQHFHIAADTSTIVPPYAPSGYDPLVDTAALRANPQQFEALRGNYPLRRE